MVDVTVCIPTIPPRVSLLERAMKSALAQTHAPDALAIAVDSKKQGAWATRMKAVEMAKTEWVAFLDDDDEFLPHHLETLLRHAQYHQADCVWGWFEVLGGTDPFPHYKGRQYDPKQPHIVPITYIAKRELLMDGPGFQADVGGSWDVQDQPVLDYIHANGKMIAANDITWRWHHHGRNTSGLPTRW